MRFNFHICKLLIQKCMEIRHFCENLKNFMQIAESLPFPSHHDICKGVRPVGHDKSSGRIGKSDLSDSLYVLRMFFCTNSFGCICIRNYLFISMFVLYVPYLWYKEYPTKGIMQSVKTSYLCSGFRKRYSNSESQDNINNIIIN